MFRKKLQIHPTERRPRPMATTRIISMHVSHGKTIADCLTDRIDYSKNPDKTQGGELISAYECDSKTADAEFLYSKRQYQTVTGREQRHDVIAYQVRQSFKPGEITPEEANRVGYEFAERFLKGRHAFFVATHTDKKHIHNHINNNFYSSFCFFLFLPLNASHFLSLHCSNFNFLLPRFSNLQNSRCSFGAQKAPAVSCRGCFCVTPRCTRSTRAPCPARRPCPRATPWRDRGRGPSRCSRGP